MKHTSLATIIFVCSLLFFSCENNAGNNKNKIINPDKQNAIEAILLDDSSVSQIPMMVERIKKIKTVLLQKIPIILLDSLDATAAIAQQIAISDAKFCENIFDKKTKQPFRNEIFNVYPARPQEVPNNLQNEKIYKIEMYNYALNLTTTALVNTTSKTIVSVTNFPVSQPDIPIHLKNIALQIAINNPEVIQALGYKPEGKEALMANTKTALNNTKCERSLHLCVAPTFIKNNKALWVIVDLTDYKIVGIRWTNVGTTEAPENRISERKLKFEKIMECYCKKVTHLEKYNWKLNYVITTSDGMRISEVAYNDKVVVNNAKIVDWHVGYSNTDGFGYSDAVGCPEFSQAAVVAVSDPRVSDIIESGKTIGFALEQNFSSEQWPLPCNYNYLQRFEFYNDGKFRTAAASLGRGCGNNGTYRPVIRIAFAGNNNSFSEWNNTNWNVWNKEQWKLQNPTTTYTSEGYQYKISNEKSEGFYIEPNKGQFNDGSRGDNAYVFVTKQHFDKDEGEKDLITIGPCCNTDYKQGPEKFIEPSPESIINTDLVVWYVPQMKNDDTKGIEYCWAESYLENGVYKTRTYPCIGGPMFIPIKSLEASR
ncbi:MAG: hypothetical protein ACOVO1_10550 [Chitinophagaceae bacterium]